MMKLIAGIAALASLAGAAVTFLWQGILYLQSSAWPKVSVTTALRWLDGRSWVVLQRDWPGARSDAVERIEANAKNTLAAMADGDELRTLLAALRRFTKMTPINTVAARQRIADAMIEANKYVY